MQYKESSAPVSEISERVKALLPEFLHRVIDSRTELGWKKYGQSLDDNIKSVRQKSVHLLQELLDSLQYIEWLRVDAIHIDGSEIVTMIEDILTEIPDLTFDEMSWREGYQE